MFNYCTDNGCPYNNQHGICNNNDERYKLCGSDGKGVRLDRLGLELLAKASSVLEIRENGAFSPKLAAQIRAYLEKANYQTEGGDANASN